MTELDIQQRTDGVVFVVKVVPGSSKTAFAGVMGKMIKIKVASAPEKGKANDCLIGFLAGIFGIRKKDVEIIRGKTSQVKHVLVRCLSMDQVRGGLVSATENI